MTLRDALKTAMLKDGGTEASAKLAIGVADTLLPGATNMSHMIIPEADREWVVQEIVDVLKSGHDHSPRFIALIRHIQGQVKNN